jgi:hypothetical protein
MKPFLLILWFAPLFAFAQPILPFPGGSPFPVPGFPPTTLPVPQTAPLIYYTQDTFNSYTVTEKPLFYINDTLTIKADDPNLSVYAQPAGTYTSSFTKGDLYIDGDKDNPMYDGTLTLVGTLVRNGTSQYDLQIVIKRNNTLISGPRINGIPQQSLARGAEIPVVFDPMTDLHVTDELYILNMRTNSVLFGPMEVGKVAGYQLRDYYAQWYQYTYTHPIAGVIPSEFFITKDHCDEYRIADTRTPTTPCLSTWYNSIEIYIDQANSRISQSPKFLKFRIDTHGLPVQLQLRYGIDRGSLIHTVDADPQTITTVRGKPQDIEISLDTVPVARHYSEIFDAISGRIFFAGYLDMNAGDLTQRYTTFTTELGQQIDALVALDDISPVFQTGEISLPDDLLEGGVFQNPLGDSVRTIPEFFQMLFRKAPSVIKPLVVFAIISLAFSTMIKALNKNSQEPQTAKSLRYILMGASLIIGAYVIGSLLTVVVSCLSGGSC